MLNCPRFVCVTVLATASVAAGFGQEAEPAAQPIPIASTFAQSLAALQNAMWRPAMQFFASLFQADPATAAEVSFMGPEQPVAVCSVAPLDAIDDPAALELEAGVGPASVVDIRNMMPAAARALDRFQTRVEKLGGTIVLKSAYRPASYQKHLQDVWYKWMDELRNDTDPACQGLRAQVQDEFTRHRLIETQHPVAVSDHTRGLAFDATVALPLSPKLGRRFTLDGLAHLAGLTRPAIAADPVHFKFLGGVKTVLRRRNG